MLLNLHCQPGSSLCVGMQIHCKHTFNTFIGTNHSIYTENKDAHIVQIKLKAVKGFKNFG